MGKLLGTKREATFWATVAALLPFAYASSFVAIGPTPAEGCSGAPAESREGVIWLSAFDTDTHVARDGFFPFRATTANVDETAALEHLSVEVRNDEGDLVPGETVVIKVLDTDDSGTRLLLGWSATGTTRSYEERLTFHAMGTNSDETVTLDASLIVMDVEPELTLPSFEVTGWTRVKYDAGDSLPCDDFSDCDSSSVGAELREAQRMTLEASGVAEPVLVLWEYDWVPVAGKGTFVGQPSSFGPQSSEYSEEVSFATGLDEYCVRVRGTDLRTGDTEEAEVCASPSSDSPEVIYDSIWECAEPPEGYLERWCRAMDRVGDPLGDHAEECEPYLNPTAGTGGAGGQDPGSGGAPDPGAGGSGSGARGGGSPVGTAGGTATGGTKGGTDPEPAADAGAPPPEGSGGSAGGPDDDETPDAGTGDSRTVVTKGGCGCRTAGATGSDTALAGVGLLALALGLGMRRRGRERDAV
jgi:MYXO-CTERM domain-containing protein